MHLITTFPKCETNPYTITSECIHTVLLSSSKWLKHTYCEGHEAPLDMAPAPLCVDYQNIQLPSGPMTFLPFYLTYYQHTSDQWHARGMISAQRPPTKEAPAWSPGNPVAWLCVSLVGPAVDAGEEGDGRRRERKDPRKSQSPEHIEQPIPFIIPTVYIQKTLTYMDQPTGTYNRHSME